MNLLEKAVGDILKQAIPVEPAYVKAIQEHPKKAITRARCGSAVELDALIVHLDYIPDNLINDLLQTFLHHLSKDPHSLWKSAAQYEHDLSVFNAAAISFHGIQHVSKYVECNSSTQSPLREHLRNSWPNIIRWNDFLSEILGKLRPEDRNPLMESLSAIFAMAFVSDDLDFKRSIEKSAPEHLAKLWLVEDSHADAGASLAMHVGYCIMFAEDRANFMKTFVAKSVGSEEDLISKFTARGAILLKTSPISFSDLSSIIFLFHSFSSEQPLPIWDSCLRNDGVLCLILKTFKALSQQTCKPDSQASLCMSRCLMFFCRALLHGTGDHILTEMVKPGNDFFQSFVDCAPFYSTLVEEVLHATSSIITHIIPSLFVKHSVIKDTSLALEALDLKAKQEKISNSCIKNEWDSFEAILLEQATRNHNIIAKKRNPVRSCRLSVKPVANGEATGNVTVTSSSIAKVSMRGSGAAQAVFSTARPDAVVVNAQESSSERTNASLTPAPDKSASRGAKIKEDIPSSASMESEPVNLTVANKVQVSTSMKIPASGQQDNFKQKETPARVNDAKKLKRRRTSDLHDENKKEGPEFKKRDEVPVSQIMASPAPSNGSPSPEISEGDAGSEGSEFGRGLRRKKPKILQSM